MLLFNLLDVLLLIFYTLIAFLILKRSWFYSFYEFTRFLLFLIISFLIAKLGVFYNPPILNLSDIHFYLLLQVILLIILWFTVRFQKLFIFLNSRTINLDQFVFFHHLNSYLNHLPSLVVAFFATFTLFTLILSFSATSPALQAMVENSYSKEIPYRIYFASNINGSALFNNILYRLPEETAAEAPEQQEEIIPPEVISEQQAMINEEREKVGLTAVTPELILSTPIPEATILPQPSATPLPASGTITIPVKKSPPVPRATALTIPITTPEPTIAEVVDPLPAPEPTEEPMTPDPKPDPVVNIEELEMRLFALINEQRIQNNLSPFEWDPALVAVAKAHSIDMDRRDFFDHVNPDGLTPFQRMKLGGITYQNAAENIVGTSTPELMIRSWMNSEGHRKNILNPEFNKTGVGISENKKYGLIGTQALTN